jgi:hypothetical protein
MPVGGLLVVIKNSFQVFLADLFVAKLFGFSDKPGLEVHKLTDQFELLLFGFVGLTFEAFPDLFRIHFRSSAAPFHETCGTHVGKSCL